MKILRVESDNGIRDINMSNADWHSMRDRASNATGVISGLVFGQNPAVTTGDEFIFLDSGNYGAPQVYGIVYSIGEMPDDVTGLGAIDNSLSNAYLVLQYDETNELLYGLNRNGWTDITADIPNLAFINICQSNITGRATVCTVKGSDVYTYEVGGSPVNTEI